MLDLNDITNLVANFQLKNWSKKTIANKRNEYKKYNKTAHYIALGIMTDLQNLQESNKVKHD